MKKLPHEIYGVSIVLADERMPRLGYNVVYSGAKEPMAMYLDLPRAEVVRELLAEALSLDCEIGKKVPDIEYRGWIIRYAGRNGFTVHPSKTEAARTSVVETMAEAKACIDGFLFAAA